MSAEGWVRELWAGGHGATGAVVRTLLLPVEGLFRAATALRAARYRRGLAARVSPDIPVVAIGNLSVGGTGKTPMASWVVRTLADAGARPAIVARGYGRDELELHRSWTPQVGVYANVDRAAGVAAAAAEGAGVAVLDDGFQHLRLVRDLDVVLVSAEQGAEGPRLPRGPFREGIAALHRAGVVIVTRKSASAERAEVLGDRLRQAAPHAIHARVHLAPGDFGTLLGAATDTPSSARVLTSVAQPETVRAAAEALGVAVEDVHAFPDHHDFTDAEVARALGGGAGSVVVTEKDAVKLVSLPSARNADVRVLRQTVVFEAGEAQVRGAVLRAAGVGEGAR